jgi:hypothetical protein
MVSPGMRTHGRPATADVSRLGTGADAAISAARDAACAVRYRPVSLFLKSADSHIKSDGQDRNEDGSQPQALAAEIVFIDK